MQNTHKLLAVAMALPLALGLSVPASAETRNGAKWSETRYGSYADDHRDYRAERRVERRIERKLDRLSNQIRQARRSGVLNRHQARNFRYKLKAVERNHSYLARNGLSRRDIRITMRRIANLTERLEAKRYRYAQRAHYNGRADGRRGNRRAIRR